MYLLVLCYRSSDVYSTRSLPAWADTTQHPTRQKTAVRPITAAVDSKLTPLMDLMLAVDKLFVGELHAMTFELFHPTTE